MLNLYLNLIESLHALFSLDVNINSHDFVCEYDTKTVSFDPGSIWSWISRTHSKFLYDFVFNLEVYLRRMDCRQAE